MTVRSLAEGLRLVGTGLLGLFVIWTLVDAVRRLSAGASADVMLGAIGMTGLLLALLASTFERRLGRRLRRGLTLGGLMLVGVFVGFGVVAAARNARAEPDLTNVLAIVGLVGLFLVLLGSTLRTRR
jgi:hypothetical protein